MEDEVFEMFFKENFGLEMDGRGIMYIINFLFFIKY